MVTKTIDNVPGVEGIGGSDVMPIESSDVDKQREYNEGGCTGKGFMPGQSGNPAGRPVNPESLTNILRKLGNQRRVGKQITRLEELALRIWDNSLEGQFNYSQELYNRLEGKVSDQVEVTDKTEALLEELARNRGS